MIKRALIVAEPWIDLILDGKKILEMRSKNTNIRGRIGLIRKGSGQIEGEVCLTDSVKVNNPEIFSEGNCIDYGLNPELKKYNYAWSLRNQKRYAIPIPYKHPKGAVVWVKVKELT